MLSISKLANFTASLSQARLGKPISLFRLCIIALCVVSVGCSQEKEPEVFLLDGEIMGTTYHITLVSNPGIQVSKQTMQMRVDKRLETINQIMSTYISDSELSLLNQAPLNEWFVVSDELFFVLAEAQDISLETGGAFDVTVGPLVNLWGFGPENRSSAPTDKQIAEVQASIGFRFLKLNSSTRQARKQRDIYIDLSAIAKGYATDQIAILASNAGFRDYMVEIGGELRLSGNSPTKRPWRIGVEKPSLIHSGKMQTISITEGGLATSGDYRNYYEDKGVRVSHTIDPETGRPITHRLASVTVVSVSAARADALATALNVMGPETGFNFAGDNDLAAYFIVRDGEAFKVKHTEKFEKYILSEQ